MLQTATAHTVHESARSATTTRQTRAPLWRCWISSNSRARYSSRLAGGGHIAEVLKNHGYEVTCADIVRRDYEGQDYEADFLRDPLKWCGDIVTNPPYKYAAEFVQHALDVIDEGRKVAMFLKLTFLEGEKRRGLFEQNPPARIHVFTKRVNCALNGEAQFFNASSAVCYAWFVWDKGYKGKPVIDWI